MSSGQQATALRTSEAAASARVLVTGANGFLGGAVCKALIEHGYQVKAGYRREPIAAREQLTPVRLDVSNPEQVNSAVQGMNFVIHVAGLTGLWGPWKDYYDANVLGTQHVLNACRAHGVSRLVFTSSPSVTFDGGDQCGIDEKASYPDNWLCHYPRSKALAEQLVLAANEARLHTCALRPHLIWGPGDLQLVPELVRRTRAGRLRQIGAGENLIDVTHVDNAALAHVAALRALKAGSAACGKAYFISQSEPVNCWDWIREVLGYFDTQMTGRPISAGTAWRAASAFETVYKLLRIRRQPLLTRFLVAQLSTSHYFDNSAARRDLGYQPVVSMAEGMRQLAECARTQPQAFGLVPA